MAWTKEQNEAIHRDGTNIIVSAGAGSGKTAVLTERVLEKVKNGVPITGLLILTFTKMAASEMRERIGNKLKKENLNDALNDLDKANITTFDAYSLSLVKKYYYLLGVSPDINIIDSSVIYLYKEKVLNKIFEDLYNKEDKDFLSLIKDYSLKDDKELFNFILTLNDKLDLKIDKIDYIDNYIDNYYSEEKIDNDINIYTNNILRLIDKIRHYLEYIDDTDYLNKLSKELNYLLSSFSYNEIKESIDIIKLPRCTSDYEITKEYKDKINNVVKEIKELCSFNDINDIKEGIYKTKNNIGSILNIIKLLDKEVFDYKNKYNYYEYHDIAYLAIKLVKDFSHIREEIKSNLDEILIDEYQDTNDIQEKFISYISKNNVYVVGDIKQSIYKFRNANPYIFKDKYEKYSRNDNGYKIDLNKNFRSREEVINNINLIFERIMDDSLGGASYKESHEMIFGNNTYNEVGFNNQNNNLEIYSYNNTSIYSKEEVEAFTIAKDIISKIDNNYKVFDKNTNTNRDITYNDFAILIDNSKNFDLFKKILEYKNIPASIVKDSNLLEGSLITIIKNIINLIIKIKNDIIDDEFKHYFLSLGRSFLFNVDDNTLFNYFVNNNYYESNIYTITKEISNNIEDIPLTSIVDIIIDKYDIYNKLFLVGDYKENILKLDKLKEIVNNLEGLNYTVYDLSKYLTSVIEESIPIKIKVGTPNENSVRIMTIHASKGLEFPIVYFPSLYNRFNIREAINKFSYDESLGIIIPYKDNFLYNTIYHNLSYKNYVRENIGERIRLFYVALTRAREKIIMLLPSTNKEINTISDIVDTSIREKYKSFSDFLYSVTPIIKKYYKDIDISTLKLTKKYNLSKILDLNINKDNTKLQVEEINLDINKEEEKRYSKDNIHFITKNEQYILDRGTRLHELLELTDFKNINSNLSSEDKEVINNFISNIDLNYINIYKEYEFIDNNSHGIIDLMLEYDDYIKIIDYKLKNITDTAYINQLNGYKKYIEKIFNKRVYIYLYSINDNKLEDI